MSSEILSRASPFLLISTMSNEIGFDIESTEKCQKIKEVKQYKHIIKDSLNDYNKNLILNKIKNLNGSNKIYLYKFLKQNENEMEYYLSHPDIYVRLILTKFRLSEHKLAEISKYQGTNDYVRFAMSWKTNFIFFSLNAREIPIIETRDGSRICS